MSKDIIRMAREAGFQTGNRDYADGNGAYPYVVSVTTGNFLVELKAFEALIRADEREACVLDIQMCIPRTKPDTEEMIRMKNAISRIRARSNK